MENKRFDVELVKSFVEASKSDLSAAVSLLKDKNYNNSIFHSQQAVEKIVKAILIVHGKFKATHIVSPELKRIQRKEKIGNDVVSAVRALERHWVVSRYPFRLGKEVWNPAVAFDELDAREALEKARFVVKEIGKILKERYGVEV